MKPRVACVLGNHSTINCIFLPCLLPSPPFFFACFRLSSCLTFIAPLDPTEGWYREIHKLSRFCKHTPSPLTYIMTKPRNGTVLVCISLLAFLSIQLCMPDLSFTFQCCKLFSFEFYGFSLMKSSITLEILFC